MDQCARTQFEVKGTRKGPKGAAQEVALTIRARPYRRIRRKVQWQCTILKKGVPKTIHITHQKHHKQVADGSEVMQPEHDIV